MDNATARARITAHQELRIQVVIVGLQSLGVFGVADEPVYGREMLALSQLFVQSPEDLQSCAQVHLLD